MSTNKFNIRLKKNFLHYKPKGKVMLATPKKALF